MFVTVAPPAPSAAVHSGRFIVNNHARRSGLSRQYLCSQGFTLIEMMMVVIIVGILVGIAMPSLRLYVASQSLRAQVSDFAGTVRLARTEAIKRGRTVTLCRTADANATPPACAAGDDWSSGWLLLVGSEVIRVQQAYPNSGGIVRDGAATLEFLPNGLALGAAGSFRFQPKLPTTDGAYEGLTKQVCVLASGGTRPC